MKKAIYCSIAFRCEDPNPSMYKLLELGANKVHELEDELDQQDFDDLVFDYSTIVDDIVAERINGDDYVEIVQRGRYIYHWIDCVDVQHVYSDPKKCEICGTCAHLSTDGTGKWLCSKDGEHVTYHNSCESWCKS